MFEKKKKMSMLPKYIHFCGALPITILFLPLILKILSFKFKIVDFKAKKNTNCQIILNKKTIQFSSKNKKDKKNK